MYFYNSCSPSKVSCYKTSCNISVWMIAIVKKNILSILDSEQ